MYTLLSTLYCLLLVLLGLMFSLADALQSTWLQTYYTGIFLVYMYTTATVALLVLQLCILPASTKKNESETKPICGIPITLTNVTLTNGSNQAKAHSSNPNPITVRGTANITPENAEGDLNDSGFRSNNERDTNQRYKKAMMSKSPTDLGDLRARTYSSISHHWMEQQEQHVPDHPVNHGGSSFYLRIGFLVFGMGHMIYVIMEIDYRLISVPEGCPTDRFSWTFILRLIFLAVQTFFLFKNSTVNITKLRTFSEFSFKHLISTNIIVWLRTLISEIEETLLHSQHTHSDGYQNESLNDSCAEDREIITTVRPYLFPFVLEYSLIAVGIFGILCSKVVHNQLRDRLHKNLTTQNLPKGNHKISSLEHDDEDGKRDVICEESEASEAFGPMHCKQNHTIVTFKSSNKGLLLGACVLCCTIVSITVFFFDLTADDLSAAQKNFLITDLSLHGLMLLACVGALWSLNSVPIKDISFTQVDDILLFVAMAGSILFEISIVISCSVYLDRNNSSDGDFVLNSLALVSATVSAVQTLLQTILIELGLRKYCASSKQQESMKGREAITFLIVCNVTVWIFRTMQVKEIEMGIQEEFYGVLAWLFIMNISLPFLLFFYFHSSICLADIWVEAYHFTPTATANTTRQTVAVNKSDSILSFINSSFVSDVEDTGCPSTVIDTTHM